MAAEVELLVLDSVPAPALTQAYLETASANLPNESEQAIGTEFARRSFARARDGAEMPGVLVMKPSQANQAVGIGNASTLAVTSFGSFLPWRLGRRV